MTDGLKDKHRAAIVAAIAANDRVERAVLFGSRATGTNTATSDVDIALFGDRLTLTDQAYLSAALDEIPMAQSVDLLLYDSIQSRKLREHIRRQGIEWYARPPREEGNDNASDSGAEWPVVKLEEVSSDEPGAIAIGPFGSRMKSDVYTLSGVPVIRGTNISTSRAWRNEWVYVSDDFADGLPNCNVREGDLVFPHRGSIGEVAIVPGDRDRYMLSTSLMKFRPDPNKVSPLFLFYYFRSDTGRAEIMQYSSQVGTPGIGQPLTSLRQFQVPIPPREEQERVADILSTLDDKIELNRRMNETLEEMARAVFKSWFVDFDPVRAKATLKSHATTFPQMGSDWSVERARAYLDRMDSNIATLFPDGFMDSALGPIPAGWEVGCFGDVVEQIRDKENPLASPDAIFHHFSIPAFDEYQWPKAERGETIKSHKSRVLPGVVLLSKLNPEIERVWLVDVGATDRAVCSTEFLVLRPRPSYGTSFVYCLGCSPAFQQELGSLVTGTSKSHQRVQADTVLALPVVLFPKSISEAFERKLSVVLQMTQANRRGSRALVTLRDTLLPKLVSGEMRVGVGGSAGEN